MMLSVSTLTPIGFHWKAVFVDEAGAVVASTLVSGRTRRQAMVSARAIAQRVSSASTDDASTPSS